jgi:glycolate oxidase FAD binding subunit
VIQQTDAIAQTLEPIIGTSSLSNTHLDEYWKAQITSAISPETEISCLVYPNTQEELAAVIACAHRNRWRILPCGSGSKLSWGGLVQGVDVVVSTQRLNRLIEHAVGDLTVTAEAGMKLSELQAILAKEGQFLALDPAYCQTATLGGIVATADCGSLRQRYGGVRDMLLGLSFVRADGAIAKAGGRVVKNVAGYDLMKLFTGSYGTLGIISQVTFRVYPLPEASQTLVLTGTADNIAQATQTLLASALTPTAIDVLSTGLVTRLGMGEGMGLMTRFQSVTESVKEQSARLLEVGRHLGLQGSSYSGNDEATLWHQLVEPMQESAKKSGITCKIGVLPVAAVATLTQLDRLASQSAIAFIHAGSGLGLLQWENPDGEVLGRMRSHCQSHSGFLTVLEAPMEFKQQIDVWGYTGNALDLMRKIKQQFDPENIFSPHRFVGGI